MTVAALMFMSTKAENEIAVNKSIDAVKQLMDAAKNAKKDNDLL